MKCGEKGWLTVAGAPCQQNIGPDASGCLWHSRTKAERHDLAMKGALNASLKQVLPDDFELGDLMTIEDMKAFLRKMIPHVLQKPIERWRSTEARGWFGHLVELDRNRVQEKLADAVLTAQHGGQSLIFLNQYLDGSMEGRRKLPSRVKAVTDASGVES